MYAGQSNKAIHGSEPDCSGVSYYSRSLPNAVFVFQVWHHLQQGHSSSAVVRVGRKLKKVYYERILDFRRTFVPAVVLKHVERRELPQKPRPEDEGWGLLLWGGYYLYQYHTLFRQLYMQASSEVCELQTFSILESKKDEQKDASTRYNSMRGSW